MKQKRAISWIHQVLFYAMMNSAGCAMLVILCFKYQAGDGKQWLGYVSNFMMKFVEKNNGSH